MASDIKRQSRIRGKMKKYNPTGLRLTVFRSLKNIYAQVIDDAKNQTLVSASSVEQKELWKKELKRFILTEVDISITVVLKQ